MNGFFELETKTIEERLAQVFSYLVAFYNPQQTGAITSVDYNIRKITRRFIICSVDEEKFRHLDIELQGFHVYTEEFKSVYDNGNERNEDQFEKNIRIVIKDIEKDNGLKYIFALDMLGYVARSFNKKIKIPKYAN